MYNVQKHAAAQAESLLKAVWDGRLPVDPAAIAEKILINVENEDGKASYPISIRPRHELFLNFDSGIAELIEEDGQYIFICSFNKNERPQRQRFTIAHELGHVLLGHVKEGQSPKRDNNFVPNGDPDEMAANQFAASLLMPEKLVRELSSSITDLNQLAKIFNVSQSAMGYRLKGLGIV